MPHCPARESVAEQSCTSGGAGERRGDFSLVRCDWPDSLNRARFVRKQKRKTLFTSGISHRWDQRKDRSDCSPASERGEGMRTLSDRDVKEVALLKERIAAFFEGDSGVHAVPGDDERVIGKGGQLSK